ncbi:hypothetical protein HWV62_21604 [Athelia sp. TMB]|nr:hypothetical protein HWV62_21604 [Athelia sp. TMB]
MNNALVTNSSHSEGYTTLTFSPDGRFAYTAGSDSMVRIWRTSEGADQEPPFSSDADQEVYALASWKDGWVSGSGDGFVRSYRAGDKAMTGSLTQATLPIRSLAVDPTGCRVAVASDEFPVKIVDIEDNSKITILDGHTNGVRTVTWHTSGTLLSTTGSDGKIIIWDVSQDPAVQEKVIQGVIPVALDTDPEFAHDASVIWHPSGYYFFVATKTHDIVTISRPGYEYPNQDGRFSDSELSGPITALALSPNGLYLASASLVSGKGVVCIWSVEKKQVLWRYPCSSEATITKLSFSPTQNLLAWTDEEGVFSRWPSPVPSSFADPIKKPTAADKLFDDDVAAIDDDHYVPLDDDDDEMGVDADPKDWIVEDRPGDMDDIAERDRVRGRDHFVKEMVSITKSQSAFQPGSTPMDRRKRYLAFNMLGAIEVTEVDDHHVLNVSFHDQSSRKGYTITDHSKYDMASLGERGVLFACQSQGGHPAHVRYKPYTAWSSAASHQEWTYDLGGNVAVIGLAAGGSKAQKSGENDDDTGNLVIATSDNDLTFLSGNKTERFIMGLDGDFVSMVAGEEWVFYVHRPGATTIDGSQGLMGTIVTFDSYCILQSKPLPIRKGHTLKWVGITDEGAPAIYDSSGLLHVMANFRKAHMGCWARMLDTNAVERGNRQESYWPIGANQEKLTPFPSDVDMRIPFRGKKGTDSTKPTDTDIEEQLARSNIFLEGDRDALGDELTSPDIARREVEQDKKLIKLINNACKEDKSARAIELVNELHHLQTFDSALKIAAFYRLVGLREKIEALKSEREDNDRLLGQRDRRRELAAQQAPIPKLTTRSGNMSPPPDPNRPKPLEDFRPPPTMHRPGLAPAVPVVATTKYSAANLPTRGVPASRSTTPPEIKRKRDEDVEVSQKRPALETDSISSKPKNNPFARKAGQETKNPFARKVDNKTIQKSESFFDKVDAAESEPGKRPAGIKAKGAKEPSRQSTLFGLPLGQAAEKKSGRKKKSAAESEVSQTASDSVPASSLPLTSSDITMAEPQSEATLVETQLLDEPFEKENMETTESQETQPLESQDESMDAVIPSPLLWTVDALRFNLQDLEDPIEWPASPSAISATE